MERLSTRELVALQNSAGAILAVKNPEQLRSRYAVFDPSKIESRNLLASLAAVGGVSLVLDDEEEQQRVHQVGSVSPGGGASDD